MHETLVLQLEEEARQFVALDARDRERTVMCVCVYA